MSAIREIGAKDSFENKIFRFFAPFLFFDHLKKSLNAELYASFCTQTQHAKPTSEILEAIDYEEFPPLSSIIAYLFTMN